MNSKPSLFETRRDQMFPVLEESEIERMRRFGTPRSYRSGEVLVSAGESLHSAKPKFGGVPTQASVGLSGEKLDHQSGD